jgi:hypothetical protein
MHSASSVSRHHPHKRRGHDGANNPPKSKKRKPTRIGFAPWFSLVGMFAGMALGLRSGRTLIPMQIGGLLGAFIGVVIDWFRKTES